MKNADKIKLFAFDVDGTLTNGTLVLGPDGEAYKFFNVKDGLAPESCPQDGLQDRLHHRKVLEDRGRPRKGAPC